jgi:glyoxylase I family protein
MGRSFEHAETGTVLCPQRHNTNARETFDPRRTGLDHVAFKVAEPAELELEIFFRPNH